MDTNGECKVGFIPTEIVAGGNDCVGGKEEAADSGFLPCGLGFSGSAA